MTRFPSFFHFSLLSSFQNMIFPTKQKKKRKRKKKTVQNKLATLSPNRIPLSPRKNHIWRPDFLLYFISLCEHHSKTCLPEHSRNPSRCRARRLLFFSCWLSA